MATDTSTSVHPSCHTFRTMNTLGLWQFPPPAPPQAKRCKSTPAQQAAERSRVATERRAGWRRNNALIEKMRDIGAAPVDIFEEQAYLSLMTRLKDETNRCPRCWHDKEQRCICRAVGSIVKLSINVKVIILMHHKEYHRASDDAKLLPMLLPPEQVELLIFGRPGDLGKLDDELDADPHHSLLLWPGEHAQTVSEFIHALPATSPWRRAAEQTESVRAAGPILACAAPKPPVLRVVVLDAVYRHARTMFRRVSKMRARRSVPLQHVALHPTTLSVYSRAQNGYAQASAASVAESNDPDALRICTVEAFALLLSELGETEAKTQRFVDGVLANNAGLRKGPVRLESQ